MTILSQLQDPEARRSKAAQRIAVAVMQNPADIVGMSIAALAQRAGVSEPSVNRFCTALGMKGFPDFKVKLAAELARREPGIARDVHVDDSIHQIGDKIFDATIANLQATRQQIDTLVVERAVSRLHNARSILLCGQGASASVAQDAQHKLMIFGTPVTAHADPILQRIAVDTLGPDDCLVCISYTGRTIAMVELAAVAKARGVPVIGITAIGSALARQCDQVLPVAPHEDTDTYMPMSSRIAQLVLVDVLATALAVKRGPEFTGKLRQMKQHVVATRRAGNDVH